MAEQEPTPEQLAAIAAENEDGESVNYKPPAQKSLQEIQELDKDDESLRKYKEALLGSSNVIAAGVWRFIVHALSAPTYFDQSFYANSLFPRIHPMDQLSFQHSLILAHLISISWLIAVVSASLAAMSDVTLLSFLHFICLSLLFPLLFKNTLIFLISELF